PAIAPALDLSAAPVGGRAVRTDRRQHVARLRRGAVRLGNGAAARTVRPPRERRSDSCAAIVLDRAVSSGDASCGGPPRTPAGGNPPAGSAEPARPRDAADDDRRAGRNARARREAAASAAP